ncbi:MAG: gfo/Idh/MocA family oxidoreductase [Chloroflexi bacterium]|nr:MAG: gfo/Idh/MocA family oxidoreductase [Chloroflexota bacterium]
MNVIRAAVIGTGFIGPAHVEALRRLGIEVTGIAGSSPERARPKAEALNIPRVYADWRELVADPEVDVVHIATPNHLHYPMTRAAIEAGKHVVCEKPLAMNSQESAQLLRLAEKAGVVHAVNYNIRFYPLCQEARARVARGDLGHVYIIRGSYLQDWLFYETDWNWRLEPELGGSLRAVADIGTHWMDLTGFITGLKVEAVWADFHTFIPVRKKPTKPIDTFAGKELKPEDYVEQAIHTEDYATVLLAYEGGARGVMTVSQVSAGRKNRLAFEIDGAKLALAWNSERPNELWIGHRDGPNEVLMKDPSLLTSQARDFTAYPGGHNEGFPDTFKMLYRAVYRYIEAGDLAAAPDFPTFADGHEEILLCEAIERSAREHEWVAIER